MCLPVGESGQGTERKTNKGKRFERKNAVKRERDVDETHKYIYWCGICRQGAGQGLSV